MPKHWTFRHTARARRKRYKELEDRYRQTGSARDLEKLEAQREMLIVTEERLKAEDTLAGIEARQDRERAQVLAHLKEIKGFISDVSSNMQKSNKRIKWLLAELEAAHGWMRPGWRKDGDEED